MANSKTAWLCQAVLKKNLKGVDYAIPAVYVGLTVGGVEVVGNNYARVQVPFANWTDPVDNGAGGYVSQNSADILFPQASAAWGLVNGFLIATAASGGNTFYEDALTVSKQIDANDQLKIAAGDLKVNEA